MTDHHTAPISAFDLMPPDRVAPCHLDTREGSGDGDDWPGSPCLIDDELCLTCSAKTERGKRMQWKNGRPVPGTDPQEELRGPQSGQLS